MSAKAGRKKILAVASGGGHWIQLRRIAPAFEAHDVTYVTVERTYKEQVGDASFKVVVDATRWNKFKMLWMLLQMFWIVSTLRPNVVVSTGAVPGYFAIRLARLFGARSIWIDSIANVEVLSLAGQNIGRYADLWLTQWPHLASDAGPEFRGAVM